MRSAVRQSQFGDGHAVFCERPGLVRAQDCGGAQSLNRIGASREDASLGNTPRAHRHEDGKHDWEFLWQHRHADRDASKDGIKPSASQSPIEHNDEEADDCADRRKDDDEFSRLRLEVRINRFKTSQRLADLADLAANAGGEHQCFTRSPHNQ